MEQEAAGIFNKKRREALGKVYDLESLYSRLNRVYFDNSLKLEIRWSSRVPSKAKSSVTLGQYDSKSKSITISKRLDSTLVPMYFLEHVIFHEMLHSVFPRNSSQMHTPKFKQFERLHPDYERARKWESENLKIIFEAKQTRLWV